MSGQGAYPLGFNNPFRYRGYYFDYESNLYYLQSRYYDPVNGRFLNPDAYITTGQGLQSYNMYAYCDNDPVNRIDPTGYCYYDINGNWTHDNWEYTGGYVRMPDPSTYGTYEVYLGVHKVALGNYHTSVIIFAYPGSSYYNDKRFKLFDEERGAKYVTIGAGGSDLLGFDGRLVSDLNRTKDKKLSNKVEMINLGIKDHYTISKLLEYNVYYKYNDHPKYNVLAKLGKYNSNSFTHGLLQAIGIKPPTPSHNVPGWNKPLPKKYFGQ